jgi:hypothetical protein
MARLFSIDAGLRDTALPTARPVTLRVFRFAVAASLAGRGGFWALSVPVAAIDRGVSPPQRHLIIDPTLAFTALSVASLLLFATRPLKRRGGL